MFNVDPLLHFTVKKKLNLIALKKKSTKFQVINVLKIIIRITRLKINIEKNLVPVR